ncbi:MAG: hypothetical protein GY838_06420 [bacterium]|nr:hypothetical protein [bacterium]
MFRATLPRLVALALIPACVLVAVAAADDEPLRYTLGEPGYLVLAGAADSTDVYIWQDGPGEGRRSLVWDEGMLTVPADLVGETYGRHDLGFPCGATLAGNGRGGRLVFEPGTFPIDEPLRLGDGSLDFYAADGELEIRAGRIRYSRAASRQKDPRASFIMLAGMVVLTVVLLRRARRTRESGRGR